MEKLGKSRIPNGDHLFVQDSEPSPASSNSQLQRRVYRKPGSSNDRQSKKE